MGKRRRILLVLLLLGVAVVTILIVILNSPSSTGDELFRGKPEKDWIQGLQYRDEAQVVEWRQYGDDGVRVLLRGLDRADHPYARAYRNIWRHLPSPLHRILPAPRMDLTRAARMTIADLISRLGNDAKIAEPAMARLMKDESPGVRAIAVTYFTCGEDENAPLNHLDKNEKQRLLTLFISLMKDNDLSVRNNAALALGYYPENTQQVSPVLTNALQDSAPQVRKVAAHSLKKVDPDTAAKAGIK